MRILRVIASVDAEGGGPVEGILQTASALIGMGHDIEVACLDSPNSATEERFPCRVHRLGPGLTAYRYASAYPAWLRRNAMRFDAVIVSGLWQFQSLGTWLGLRASSTPFFVFPHGMLDPWFKRTYPLKHVKKWLYWPWAEYRVLRNARAVLFTCEEERRLARQSFWLYRCHERVVNYGTAAPQGDPETQKTAFLERFPALRGKRSFLFLSRIHPKKGCELLIKAFAKVLAGEGSEHRTKDRGLRTEGGRHRLALAPSCDLRDLHLVMAGPDQVGWAAELKTLAAQLGVADRITWPGMLSGDLKWGAIRCAEAFVLPSHQENFGIAVVEAMGCGLPVLISNQVNIWREIEADRAGLVEADTEEGTTSLLSRWLALKPQEAETLRSNTIPAFNRRFEIHAAARSLIEAINGAPIHRP